MKAAASSLSNERSYGRIHVRLGSERGYMRYTLGHGCGMRMADGKERPAPVPQRFPQVQRIVTDGVTPRAGVDDATAGIKQIPSE